MSPENDQISYLTTELNFAHTRIVAQDNTIKDLEFKIKILQDSLKVSEEKLNSDLHKKYFGPVPPTMATSCHYAPFQCAQQYRQLSCPACPCSHSPLDKMTCSSRASQSQQSSEKISENNFTLNSSIQAEIDAFKIEMLDIKTKLNSLIAPTTESVGESSSSIPVYVSLPETSKIAVEVHDVLEVSSASMDEEITEIENPPHYQSN